MWNIDRLLSQGYNPRPSEYTIQLSGSYTCIIFILTFPNVMIFVSAAFDRLSGIIKYKQLIAITVWSCASSTI